MFIHSIKYIIDKLSIFVRKKCEYKTCVREEPILYFTCLIKQGDQKYDHPFLQGLSFRGVTWTFGILVLLCKPNVECKEICGSD